MPNDDAVSKALAGAKDTLAKASNFTQSVEGNPTSSFAPKKALPSYSKSYAARNPKPRTTGEDISEGLKAKNRAIEEVKAHPTSGSNY